MVIENIKAEEVIFSSLEIDEVYLFVLIKVNGRGII